MSLSANEKSILKELSEKYMEIATNPIQRQKLELWKSLNRMEMQRPMVVIDQLPWVELNNKGDLTCVISNPFWAKVEFWLRSTIYKWEHFPVDMVIEPFVPIPREVNLSGYGIGPMVDKLEPYEGSSAPSQHFTRLLNNLEDVQLIKDMDLEASPDLDRQHMEEAREYFGKSVPLILGESFTGTYGMNLGIWDYLTMLIGVEDLYYAMVDEPDFIHACLRRLTDATIAGIKKANELGLFNDNLNTCHCSYIYTDELLSDFAQGKGSNSINTWAFGLAQIFTGVSPSFIEEYEIPYLREMASHFGMVYYGCCDRLDDRLDIVKSIPNIKKISCSPWSDRKNFAENIGTKHIMSNKPSPSYIAMDDVDWDLVRSDLRLTIDLARANKVNLELILKDISTVNFQPERLTKWAEIALEEVHR